MVRVGLKSVRLHNFRSFQGDHVVEFPESGLVILKGDSGAGKSNVLLALAYAFGFCRFAVKDLQNWRDDDPVWVEVVLSTGSGDVTVRRGAKGLSVGGLNGKTAEARLDEICGSTAPVREALTYRDQVRPRKFLDMADTEVKRFLVNVLQELRQAEDDLTSRSKGFSALESRRASDTAALKAAEASAAAEAVAQFVPEDTGPIESESAGARVQLSEAEKALAVGREEVSRLSAEEDEGAREVSSRHDANIRALQEAVEGGPGPDRTVEERLRQDLARCEEFVAQATAADRTSRATFDAATEELRLESQRLCNRLAAVPGLRGDLARLRREVALLADSVCPECERAWDGANEKRAERLAKIEGVENEIASARALMPHGADLDARLRARAYEPDPKLTRLLAVERDLVHKLAAETSRLDDIARRHRADAEAALALARARADAAAASYPRHRSETARSRLAALQEAVRVAEVRSARLEGQLALARERNRQRALAHEIQVKRQEASERTLAQACALAVSNEAEYRREADYLDLLRGFRNKYFDEVLAAIGAEASEILYHLPNAAHVTLEFRTERETQAGTVVERVTPVAYVSGEERPLEAAVSGGQLTSVGLAVDLAVGRVVGNRLGCRLDWVVLDEAFNGHDLPTKHACLEMLQTYAADKLVLVVDHASEFKEMFTRVVRVVHEHGRSRFAEAAGS